MKTLLIAEDDAFLTKVYRKNLEQEGLQILTAADGQEAIDIIDAKQPDLLILDLLLPKVKGVGVLEHVRAKGYTFPVIILSNVNQEADRKECESLGIAHYFVKGDTSIQKVKDKVHEILFA